MPLYNVEAVHVNGKRITTQIEASSPSVIQASLKRQGLFVVSCREVGKTTSDNRIVGYLMLAFDKITAAFVWVGSRIAGIFIWIFQKLGFVVVPAFKALIRLIVPIIRKLLIWLEPILRRVLIVLEAAVRKLLTMLEPLLRRVAAAALAAFHKAVVFLTPHANKTWAYLGEGARKAAIVLGPHMKKSEAWFADFLVLLDSLKKRSVQSSAALTAKIPIPAIQNALAVLASLKEAKLRKINMPISDFEEYCATAVLLVIVMLLIHWIQR